ncbi:MAG: PHP domain-containing protein [Bacteroidetes bacterium]|nr:PHP domain-containing protein [Bacteroidota bacterium]
MNVYAINLLRFVILILYVLPGNLHAQEQVWYKGNIHAHSINSDGALSPETIVRWYKEHRYNFCVISDHNFLTETATLKSLFDADGKFMIFPGEEVTDKFGTKPIHLGAVFISKLVSPRRGASVAETINNNVNAIQNSSGIAILNHPNGLFHVSITAAEILEANRVQFFEVCCADFKGGSSRPSTDQIWDSVLSKGRILYGVASDDAHLFNDDARQSGTAWIMVMAKQLNGNDIYESIQHGNFYATTGVEIKKLMIDEKQIRITVVNKDQGLKTFFIGNEGKVLKVDESDEPFYVFTGNEKYVRARIERSDGAYAWLQPVFVERR